MRILKNVSRDAVAVDSKSRRRARGRCVPTTQFHRRADENSGVRDKNNWRCCRIVVIDMAVALRRFDDIDSRRDAYVAVSLGAAASKTST